MAPRQPWESGEPDGDASSEATRCSFCFGVSVYTKAMWAARAMPECRGVELNVEAKRADVEERKRRAPPPRREEFTFIGMGVSMYSPEWMEEGKHLPSVRGLGVITIRTDPDELMKRMEERKRVMRELQKQQDGPGDDREGDDHAEMFGIDDDSEEPGAPLVERDMVPMKKPVMPPVIPTPISIHDIVDKTVDNAKYSVTAMYNFWARRLDGFGDRYADSCRRIIAQMEKQATNAPHNVVWLAGQLRDRALGKRGGDDDQGRGRPW